LFGADARYQLAQRGFDVAYAPKPLRVGTSHGGALPMFPVTRLVAQYAIAFSRVDFRSVQHSRRDVQNAEDAARKLKCRKIWFFFDWLHRNYQRFAESADAFKLS
jgi:hypothetical protein